MRRSSIVAVVSLLAFAVLGTTALAKAGAITKFDQLPGNWHAGQTYTLGYTILMDGVEPYKADTTEIVIRNTTGKVLSYPGTPQGASGHYVANVYFPAAGSYTWQVTQGSFFQPMDLGTITVLAPLAASAETPAAAPAGDPAPLAITLVASLVAVGGAFRLTQLLRRRAPLAA